MMQRTQIKIQGNLLSVSEAFDKDISQGKIIEGLYHLRDAQVNDALNGWLRECAQRAKNYPVGERGKREAADAAMYASAAAMHADSSLRADEIPLNFLEYILPISSGTSDPTTADYTNYVQDIARGITIRKAEDDQESKILFAERVERVVEYAKRVVVWVTAQNGHDSKVYKAFAALVVSCAEEAWTYLADDAGYSYIQTSFDGCFWSEKDEVINLTETYLEAATTAARQTTCAAANAFGADFREAQLKSWSAHEAAELASRKASAAIWYADKHTGDKAAADRVVSATAYAKNTREAAAAAAEAFLGYTPDCEKDELRRQKESLIAIFS